MNHEVVRCKKHGLPLEGKLQLDPFLGKWVEWVCPLCEFEKLQNFFPQQRFQKGDKKDGAHQ
jgi:hypothetical protein